MRDNKKYYSEVSGLGQGKTSCLLQILGFRIKIMESMTYEIISAHHME